MRKFTFLFYLLLFICSSIYALPSDKLQLLNIQAGNADLNHKSGIGVYMGGVSVDQGTTHLRAESATTYSDKKNKLIKAIAVGTKDLQVHFWTTIDEKKPPLNAYADSIQFYPVTHSVLLIGNARIIQGNDSYSAPHIQYNTETMHIVSEASQQGRTHIIIHPDANNTKIMS